MSLLIPMIVAATCAGAPHVRHAITVNKAASCVLAKLYEPQAFCLVDASGHDLTGAPFAVTPDKPVDFGMLFNDQADFNMEYALTCVASDGGTAMSPKSVISIGADGPGVPHISTVDLYGAHSAASSSGDEISVSIDF